MGELTGKVAIVTGASKGIGAAIARAFAKAGAAIAVNYASSKADADRVVGEIVKAGGKAVAIQADVAKRGMTGCTRSALPLSVRPWPDGGLAPSGSGGIAGAQEALRKRRNPPIVFSNGSRREPLPGVDTFGCLRSLRARSALDGVSWVQGG